MVVEDKHKQQAIFITQSCGELNRTDNSLIDSMTVFKLVLVAGDNLIWEQVTITLAETQVNAKVFCLLSEKEDTINCYCFY